MNTLLRSLALLCLPLALAAQQTTTLYDVSSDDLVRGPVTLKAISAVTPAADKLPYFTSTTAAAVADITSYARNLLDDSSASAMRTTLGLVIGTDVQAYDADLASWASVTRASGFDTWVATPSGANLASLLTTALPASKGGTGLTSLSANVISYLGAADYAAMRSQLGLVIGTDVQAYDADLASWASVTRASGFDAWVATPSGANLASLLTTALPASKGGTGLTSLSANVVSYLGAADYAAMRTQLGLVIGTNVQAYDADLASWAGVTRASGFDTFVGTPSSANLRSLVTDETGTGSLYFAGGALGTPSSATLTNATGLPISTGVSGLGTGVATALAATPNATGGVLTYGGLGSVTQSYSANLAAIAGLTSAADRVPYFTGSGTAALATLTSAGRALLDDADAATQRTTLGLGTIATQAASSVALSGGSIDGVTIGATTSSTGRFTNLTAYGTGATFMNFNSSSATAVVHSIGSYYNNGAAFADLNFSAADIYLIVQGSNRGTFTTAGFNSPATTPSTSTSTGSIVTGGGIGAGGDIWAGGALRAVGGLRVTSLPTSSSGLTSGDVWNDSGTLKIVP